MRTIIVDGAWPKIAKATKADRGRRMLAVAYASELHVRMKRGDLLVTDASEPTIASGGTDAKLLADLHAKGVEVYGLDGLHAKLGVLGAHAVIGSANMSAMSAERLHEAVLITDDGAIRSQVMATVTALRDVAVRLDDDALKTLARIRVVRHGGGARRRKASIADAGHNTWLLGGKVLSHVRKETQEAIDEGTETVRELVQDEDYEPIHWTLNANSAMGRQAKRGDRVVCILRHGRGIDVSPPNTVLHCARKGKRFVVFMEPREDEVVGWREFSGWATKVGLRVGKQTCRALNDREVALIKTFDWPT